jgi:membrane-associated protease RseP (regulator of RpoE activity)
MNEMSPLQASIKQIVEKYFTIVEYSVSPEVFEPHCVVAIEKPSQGAELLEKVDQDMRIHGFALQLAPVGKGWFKQRGIDASSPGKPLYFHAILVPRMDTRPTPNVKRREHIASAILFVVTLVTVYLSALFYFLMVDPVFGYANNTPLQNFINTALFMAGMVIIIFWHEMGHKIASDKNKIPASVPFLIPGPPPIGMLGAFVSIKGDASTRNKTFDIASGGIVLGMIASIILVMVGQALSIQVSTSDYLNLRLVMAQTTNPGATMNDMIAFVRDNLNPYNILMSITQRLTYPIPSFSAYGSASIVLPDSLVILHPIAFAGWVGLYISALNLLPVSFLDGGYIFRSIFPYKWAPLVGTLVALAASFVISEYFYLFAMFGLLSACQRLNKSEIEPRDIAFEFVPLTKGRKIAAILLLVAMLFLFPLAGGRRLFGIGY